jgi:hypothetical protein
MLRHYNHPAVILPDYGLLPDCELDDWFTFMALLAVLLLFGYRWWFYGFG